jgi:putative hemolysin
MDRLETAVSHQLSISFAASAFEVREAQRLRYRVFAEEYGARFANPSAGIDEGEFDSLCEHLLVRDVCSDEVVGTYRILTSRRAQEAGRF